MSNEMNMMENTEVIKETVETGMEIATEVVKHGDGLKRFGKAAGYVTIGALAYKGIELLIDYGKSKFKTKKRKSDGEQAEVSDEKDTVEAELIDK